jgi:hypothetical protein
MQQISFHGCALGLKNKNQTDFIKSHGALRPTFLT